MDQPLAVVGIPDALNNSIGGTALDPKKIMSNLFYV